MRQTLCGLIMWYSVFTFCVSDAGKLFIPARVGRGLHESCTQICEQDCSMWTDFDTGYCTSQCMKFKATRQGKFDATFHCFDRHGYVDNVYFK